MIDLALIKQHCRIDIDDDDALLLQYRDGAIDYCQTWLSRRIYADSEAQIAAQDDHGLVLTAAITNAILLLISHWYDHRDATTTPIALVPLLQPYRLMGVM